MSKSTQYLTVADPDLQIRGEGGGLKKKIFSALRASVSSKNRGGGGPPLDTPLPSSPGRRDLLITHARCNVLGV